METHQGKSVAVVKEFQMEGSWAPVTPLKPPRPIYEEDGQRGFLGQAFMKESEDYLANFSQPAERNTPNSHQNHSQGNNIWGIDDGIYLQRENVKSQSQDTRTISSLGSASSYPSFSSWDKPLPWQNNGQNSTYLSTGFDNMSFGELLAINGSAVEPSLFSERPGDSSTWNSQPENSILNSSAVFRSQEGLPQLNQQFHGIYGQVIPNSAGSHQGWSLSNINSSPRTMLAENFTFAPSTPDSRWKADSVVASGDTNLGTQQKPNERNGLQEHEVASAMIDFQGLNNNEVTGLTTDSSPGKVSIVVDENHNPDKGDSHGIDLNKTPQKKPRRKRYLPKVVKEKKPKRTPKPKTPKPTEEKDAPRTKRKYVRKNKGEIPSNSPAGETDTINSKPTKTASKSCRRSLNFNLDGQDNSLDKSNGALDTDTQTIDHHPAGNQSGHTVNSRQGEDSVTETSQVGVAYDLNHTLNQELKTHIGLPQQGNKEVSHPDKTILTKVTEKATGNLLGNNAEESSRTYLTQSPNSSPCASSNEGVQRRGSKRVLSSITDTVNVNAESVATDHGTYCAPNHIFLHNSDTHGVPTFLVSEIHKKKRTNKGQKSHESSISSVVTASLDQAAGSENHPRVDPTASMYYQCTPAPSGTSTVTSNQLEMLMRCAENRVQLMNTWLDISRLNKKKRSKGTTRNRNLDPLQEMASASPSKSTGKSPRRKKIDVSSMRYPGDSSYNDQPNCGHSCTNALSEDTNETPRVKRRYKKQNSVITLNSGVKKGWAVVLYNGKQRVRNTSGSIPVPPLIKTLSLEAITKGLKQLDINRDQNALVPYHANKQEQNALVLYKNDGILVPFEGPFNPVKKRQQRAKVDLDDETSRVWRLLLENIDNEGIDGTDEEKVKWWENERSVFHGRVDSFIARMRLVQGDRRFTPWKGSVLDSVIGVFLTQNVSDHLSSSAFMAMAARFPIKSESCESTLSEETSAVIVEPEVCIIQHEESITWNEKPMDQPVCARNSRVIHEIVHTEEKEDVNSQERVKVVPGPVSPVDCSSESSLKATSEPRLNKENSHTTETEAASTQGDDRARDDATSPQQSMISSQNSVNSPVQPDGIMRTFSESNSIAQGLASSSQGYYFDCSTSFLGLLKMAESPLLRDSYSQIHGYDPAEYMKHVAKNSIEAPDIYSGDHRLHKQLDIHLKATTSIEMVEVESKSSFTFRKDENSTPEQSNLTTGSSVLPFVEEKNSISRSSPENMCCYVLEGEKMFMHTQTESRKDSPENVTSSAQGQTSSFWKSPNLPNSSPETADVTESTITLDRTNNHHKEVVQISENNYEPGGISDIAIANPTKSKRQRAEKDKRNAYDWDNLRKQAQANGRKKERPSNTRDSLDWEAVRHADVSEIADTIKERGMNNVLAGRIKDLLDKLVKDHGSTDLEWLRDVPPDKAKEYLLSFRGLGLKSVECVRLLTLHHLAFPVDTNVGRIAVRLGWVPLQPLPESVQLHLLELYPVLESIQKYLWPRLCKLDQKTLYELHYHLITFGKVFCTKRQPNCNACPLRGECRHFASAFASARLALPGPEERSIMASSGDSSTHMDPHNNIKPLPLPPSQNNDLTEINFGCNKDAPIIEVPSTPLSLSLMQPTHHLERKSQVNCEPIVEVPVSPEPEPEQEQTLCDIEDNFYEDPDEIPTIELNMEKFTQTLQNVMHANRELQESGMSRALVALTPEAASIPTPKLKNISRLRTEHHVYELPDTHPLVKELDKREPDDPCSYLLAIWTPGETANTIIPPDRRCSSDDPGILCNEETCSYCSSQREANTQIVRGTLLIPCRTAMRGSFPLNGTYFQVNEVFADHDSSLNPINVPRSWLWNLPRRTVYFGTSIPTIFKGLTTEEIQHCFWRGYVCVRGFDQKTRAPRPLMARLHFPASKMPRGAKGKADDE